MNRKKTIVILSLLFGSVSGIAATNDKAELKCRTGEVKREVCIAKPNCAAGEEKKTVCIAMQDVVLEPRSPFDIDINLGWQLDRFTSSDLANALNPEESGNGNQSMLVDIRFNYRFANFGSQQLWLYGNTARTIRGTEIICKDNPKFIGCAEFDGSFGEGSIPGLDTAFSILRDAESLEAHVGIRHEFWGIENPNAPGRLYWSYEYGFASIEDTDDLANISQLSLGAVVVEGDYKNSFIEFGRGRNDLWQTKRKNRNKVRVHLERLLKWGDAEISIFLETQIDFDGGKGADSVTTRIAVEVPLNAISNIIKNKIKTKESSTETNN